MRYIVAFNALLRREITRFLRTWISSILPPAITMTLYFIIFGNLIGSQIKPIHGFTYMQYIAPGLIMMSVIMELTIILSEHYIFCGFNVALKKYW